jgi:hypothetical protein
MKPCWLNLTEASHVRPPTTCCMFRNNPIMTHTHFSRLRLSKEMPMLLSYWTNKTVKYNSRWTIKPSYNEYSIQHFLVRFDASYTCRAHKSSVGGSSIKWSRDHVLTWGYRRDHVNCSWQLKVIVLKICKKSFSKIWQPCIFEVRWGQNLVNVDCTNRSHSHKIRTC